MNYIILILGFFVLCLLWYVRRTRHDFYRAQLLSAVRAYQNSHADRTFYAAPVLLSAAKVFSTHKAFWKQPMWQDIRAGKYQPAVEFLQRFDPVLALGFAAHFTTHEILPKAEQTAENYPQNIPAQLILTAVYAAKFDYENFAKSLFAIPEKKVKAPYKSWYLLLRAKYRLYETDLHAAVQDAVAAEKNYKKSMLYETAEIYYLLGETYRACAGYDVAQMMYQTSEDIYGRFGAEQRKAEVAAAKGMLMAGQERFAEAAALFQKSRKVFAGLKLAKAEGEVINQQALLFLLQKRYAQALAYAEKALAKHQKVRNLCGQAHSSEIMAMALYYQKKYDKVLQPITQAAKGYLAAKNYAAYMDAMMLNANALCCLQEPEKAESILLKMINFSKKHPSSFHVADVYERLGRLFLTKGALLKARRYYRKSLQLEDESRRQQGAMSDNYILAQIENKLHNVENAKKHYLKALAIAEELGEHKIFETIHKEFAKFNS